MLKLQRTLEHPILMLDKKSTTSEFLHNLFLQHQLDLVPEIELSSNDLLIDLAKSGSALHVYPITVLPEKIWKNYLLLRQKKNCR